MKNLEKLFLRRLREMYDAENLLVSALAELAYYADSKILKFIDEIKPDVVLLDNWLTEWKSDANGEQLSRQLKSNPKTSHIPVIIVSAVSNIKEIAEAGLADAYLKKPFDLSDLTDIVKKHLK